MSNVPGTVRWLAAAALASLALGELAWPEPQAGPASPVAWPSPSPGQAAVEPAASSAVPLLARPLFAPRRRPDAGPVAAAAAPPGRPEPPRLAGILITPARRSAIFAAAPGDGEATVVAEGGSIGAWRVETIGAASVRLAGPEGSRTVRPAFQAQTPPTLAQAQLPPPVPEDRRPLGLLLPPGFAILPNASALPAARTPP